MPSRSPFRPPTVGLVLSGGGSAASFQVGALRYLYDVQGITPTVITGTSAGSILAALLAQADDHAGQRQILDDIEQTGKAGLQQPSDIVSELGWFTELQKLTPAWQKAPAPRVRHEPRSVTLPVRGRRIKGDPGHERAPRPTIRVPRWHPSPVLETLSLVWNLGRSGTDFEVLVRGARQERSMFRPGPIFARLLAPHLFDPDRLARSPVELRIAVVALESGELRYVTGRGALVDREDHRLTEDGAIDLVQAVHASCAIPAVFPPVQLGEEHYVDGGIRENAPVEIAMSQLGVDRCYAIVAMAEGVPPDTSYADKDMLSIVLRSAAGIMADEIHLNSVTRSRAAGAVVISPQTNLLGLLDVDPGLVAIALDYGYLTAADACESATQTQRQLTEDLVETRRQIWSLENSCLAPELAAVEPPSDWPAELARLKGQLRDLVAQVEPGRLPPGASRWWSTWEEHLFEISEPPTWTEVAAPSA
jgi:NTE family protein